MLSKYVFSRNWPRAMFSEPLCTRVEAARCTALAVTSWQNICRRTDLQQLRNSTRKDVPTRKSIYKEKNCYLAGLNHQSMPDSYAGLLGSVFITSNPLHPAPGGLLTFGWPVTRFVVECRQVIDDICPQLGLMIQRRQNLGVSDSPPLKTFFVKSVITDLQIEKFKIS